MKRKWRKTLSATMAVLLAAAPMGSIGTKTWAQENGTLITESEMEEILAGDTGTSATVRTRQSVHDPSIVADDGTYYVFGSHMGTAKTTDLSNWELLYSENNADCGLFGNAAGETVSYEEAFKENAYQGTVSVCRADGTELELDFGTYDAAAWIEDNTVSGNMWAPDVIYNTTMNKWCMYLSLNGANWDSTIIFLTADDVEGPYVYQGPVVFTGFSTADSDDSFHDTDLELVLGDLDELPEKYRQRTDTSNGTWGEWWPHAIDPTVFYDDDGNLWLAYGSWSGGICMLELDENTGLRDYTVVYDSDSDTLGKSYTSDAYFGKRIAGGYYVSGEGPYIQKIGNYYYLFMSYGFYSPEGGYQMRIFRSENPDGPYVDAQGNSACYTGYVHNYNGSDTRGERLMAGYKWDSMDVAEVAQGHNSAFVDTDGKAYVIYHTKFADGTASHELRVHQLFVNEDGWLVAAPYEYDGETLSDSGYEVSQVTGEYGTILHSYVQDYADLEYATPQQIALNEDGSITGSYTGTWSVDADSPNIELVMDGHTYRGVLIEQKVDNENYSTLCFTAVNEEGLCIWGAMSSDAKSIIAQNVKNFDFGVPESTYTDIELPTEGNSGAVISWSSSDESVISADGTVAANRTEDVQITLTATISKGSYYYLLDFPVTVKAGDGTFSERTLIASYFTDNPQDLSVVMDGSLSVANPFYDGTTHGIDISGGVSVEFDVEKTGDLHMLGTILAFLGSGRLYFTPGSYLGYNATGGYFDANIKDWSLVQDYIGDGAHVKLEFLQDGFGVYVDGTLVYDEEIVSTENGGGTLTYYTKVLKWLNESAETLYFGYGSWWASVGADEANCTISNVECYAETTTASSSTADAVVWYEKDEVTLASSDAITYEENPFYGEETDCLYLAYTINFASDAAKNGWDGVMSFFNSSTSGRISVQTNPYICFNAGDGNWMDLNNPNNTANGGTNWAASAETGTDYRVEILITTSGVTMSVDGETIAVSVAKANSDSTYELLLDALSDCDMLTWGVGQAVTSYWWTELCTLSNIVIASSPNLIELSEDEIDLTTTDYLDTRTNPFAGKEILGMDLEYTLQFASDAAKNGWDGIFCFYQTTSGGRVSMQTNPYLCFNSGSGTWMDLNNPNNVASGGTNWAASAETGQDYEVSIRIRKDGVTIAIDGEELSLSEASSSSDVTAEEILSFISDCDTFTFGVGLAQTAYWNTELATIKNFSAKAVCSNTTESGNDDTDDSDDSSGDTEMGSSDDSDSNDDSDSSGDSGSSSGDDSDNSGSSESSGEENSETEETESEETDSETEETESAEADSETEDSETESEEADSETEETESETTDSNDTTVSSETSDNSETAEDSETTGEEIPVIQGALIFAPDTKKDTVSDEKEPESETIIKGALLTEEKEQEETTDSVEEKQFRTITSDKTTAVFITGDSSLLPEGASLSWEVLTDGSTYEKAVTAAKQLKSCMLCQVMELNLFDDKNLALHQLDGYVSVTVPLPDGVAETAKLTVYRLEEDGSLTACETEVSGGALTFQTNHFSTFVVTKETESHSFEMVLLVVLLLVAGAGGYLFLRRKIVPFKVQSAE